MIIVNLEVYSYYPLSSFNCIAQDIVFVQANKKQLHKNNTVTAASPWRYGEPFTSRQWYRAVKVNGIRQW